MGEQQVNSNDEPEIADNELQQALAELPDDRKTPLDSFMADLLMKNAFVTRQQLFEGIEECKSGVSASTLFAILQSKGYIGETEINVLYEAYREKFADSGLPEFNEDATFGEIALEKKHTTKAELWSAIQEQERRRAVGEEKRLGEILINRGTLTISQAKDVLVTQGKHILRCPACGEQYNVKNFSSDREYTCLSCGSLLSDTGEISSLEVSGTAFEKTMMGPAEAEDRFIGLEISGCKIISKIGEGGMGAVYKAHHIRLNKAVAIKVMAAALLGLGDEIHRKRFLREARAAAQLEHPNIMTVFDVNEYESSPYIIMQFIEGRSVGEMLDSKGKFGQSEALRIIRQAAEALESAQQHNIVHRDIKPDNIMITSAGQVKVMDFGLAKRTGSQDAGVTASGVILGTPVYMSPEQFKAEVLDGRSDIYSLGVTLYHMVAGKPPFTGNTPFELGNKHMQMPHPSPKNFSPDLSPHVCSIIDKMLAKEREERYATPAELIKDIDAALKEMASESIEPEVIVAKKHGWKYAFAALILVAAVVTMLMLSPWKAKEKPANNELENRAAQAYEEMKPRVAALLEKEKFYDCLQVLGGFPEEFSQTQVRRKVDAERARVLEKAIEVFENLLARADRMRSEGQYEKASEVSDTILARLNKIENDIGKLPESIKLAQTVKKASETKKQSSQALERYKTYLGARDKALKLLGQGRLDDAESEIEPYLSDDIPAIRKDIVGVLSAIDKAKTELADNAEKQRDEKERFDKALQLVETDRQENRFDDAKQRIEAFIRSGQPEIAEQAGQLLASIAAEEKIFIEESKREQFEETLKSDIELAKDNIANGKYTEALDIANKYQDDTRVAESRKVTLNDICARAQKLLNFQNDISEVDKLVSSDKFGEAKQSLDKWIGEEETEIKKAVQKKYREVLTAEAWSQDMSCIAGGTYATSVGEIVLGDFFIDWHEVTNEEYGKFVKATSCMAPQHWLGGRVPEGMEKHPVTWVAYEDAKAYAEWAGKRLLTEEEWEVAAGWSGEKILTYPWGDKYENGACNVDSSGTAPVSSYEKDESSAGLYDMAGNVCEWTCSKHKDNKSYIIRGGDWSSRSEASAGTAFRFPARKNMAGPQLGFRCAKDAK